MSVRDRTIVVGVTGGIACYKACELVRELVQAGATVHVVMTAGARNFVTPLTLQTLSGNPVGTELFSASEEAEIGHIRLADAADLVVVAPATANVIAKMAHGLADDLLSTVLLATGAPVLVAPAMNVHMWEHPATQENVATLARRGVAVVGPAAGQLACGHEGPGRLMEPAVIIDEVHRLLGSGDLAGEHVLVTAGPTREAIDPIRYLSNRSTGRMGYAVARAASRRGARVSLVSGPTSLAAPTGVDVVAVTTAAEMATATRRAFREATVLVMAAAVADYRPATPAARKLKKSSGGRTLRLERTDDVVRGLARRKGDRLVVGFAAETGAAASEARRKLVEKRLDLVVANDVTEPGAGFAGSTNVVHLIDHHGLDEVLPLLEKEEVADRILDWVVEARRRSRRRAPMRRSRGRSAR